MTVVNPDSISGITSVTSNTEGTLGAILRTTVNFKVNNFQDFQDL